MEEKIEIGDEVQWVDDKGRPLLGTRFIVTSIDKGFDYIAGIEFGGEIHQYTFECKEEDDENEIYHKEVKWWRHWEKTGRHFDILEALRQLRDK